MVFYINTEGFTIFNLHIPFYVIAIILLVYIIYFKFNSLNKAIKLFFKWIYKIIKRMGIFLWSEINKIYIKVRNRISFRKLKNFFHLANKKQKSSHESKQLYVGIVFIICLFLFFSYLLIPDIYNRNIPESLKPTFFIITFLILLSVWFISMLIYSFKTSLKVILLWFLIIGSFYILFLYNNNLAKIIVVPILVVIITIYPLILKRENKPRIWLWFTILIMMISLFSGIILVDDAYGNKLPVAFSLNLNGNMHTKYANGLGTIYCSSLEKNPESIIGKNLSCLINPKLNLMRFNLTISFTNNTTKSINLLNTGGIFKVEENVSNLYFEINGEKNKKQIYLSTSGNPNFESYPSIDERKERMQEFIKYLGILFTAVFISIPVMMYYLRQLSKRETLDEF